jgi:hypothetical protein
MRAACSTYLLPHFIIFSVHTATTFSSTLFLMSCSIPYGWNSLPRFEGLTSYKQHVFRTLRMSRCFPYKLHCFNYTLTCLSLLTGILVLICSQKMLYDLATQTYSQCPCNSATFNTCPRNCVHIKKQLLISELIFLVAFISSILSAWLPDYIFVNSSNKTR